MKILIPFVKFSPLDFNSTLKRHDMDKSYDKFLHRKINLCTFSKLNTIKDEYSFINVYREDFTKGGSRTGAPGARPRV